MGMPSRQTKPEKYQSEMVLLPKALANIYRIFYSKITEYTFFSAFHESVSKIDHILGHKGNLNKFRKTEITACILPDHNRMNFGFTAKELP